MKQILIALVITAFACTGTQAQTKCDPVAPKHSTAVKHKSAPRAHKQTTGTRMACRMLPFQVCSILPDRRSVSCYSTTDLDGLTPSGPTTFYGPTGPMPGEVVKFNVRTVVIKGKDRGSYCKRNKADNATICVSPGLLVRDEDGYYSYGEPVPKDAAGPVTIK